MTLEIQAPIPPARTDVVPAQRWPIGVTGDGQAVHLDLPATRAITVIETGRPGGRVPLDRFSRRAYASAAAGVTIAAAAALWLAAHDWPLHTRAGQLVTALLVLGASMFVSGGTTGSIIPRSQRGGDPR